MSRARDGTRAPADTDASPRLREHTARAGRRQSPGQRRSRVPRTAPVAGEYNAASRMRRRGAMRKGRPARFSYSRISEPMVVGERTIRTVARVEGWRAAGGREAANLATVAVRNREEKRAVR